MSKILFKGEDIGFNGQADIGEDTITFTGTYTQIMNVKKQLVLMGLDDKIEIIEGKTNDDHVLILKGVVVSN